MSEPGLNSVFDILLEGDDSGWIQMLIFAVIIGFSALSRFATQRKQKRKLEREEEARRGPVQQRPAVQREPEIRPAVQRGRQPGPGVQSEPRRARPAGEDPRRREAAGRPKPRTIIRPGSALSAFVAEIKQEIKKAAEQMQGVTPAQPKAITKPKPPAKIAEPVFEPQEPKPPVRGVAKDEIEEWGATVPELSGPEDLKRAVLYYEILGKPVSMRGPSENLIGS